MCHWSPVPIARTKCLTRSPIVPSALQRMQPVRCVNEAPWLWRRGSGRDVCADVFDIEPRAISTFGFMEVLSRLSGDRRAGDVAATPGPCIATAAARAYGSKATE